MNCVNVYLQVTDSGVINLAQGVCAHSLQVLTYKIGLDRYQNLPIPPIPIL